MYQLSSARLHADVTTEIATESGWGASTAAVLLGALILMWPAIFNGYPLLYSDTNAFLDQGVRGIMIWDKPFIYGPWLLALHWKSTLWLPCAAQAVVLSWMIWLARSVVAPPGALRHIVVCAILGLLTAAPWFASLLMPDIFSVVTVLGIFVLAYLNSGNRVTLFCVALVTALAIGAHLTHILIAVSAIAIVALFRSGSLLRTIGPLVLALAVIASSNVVSFGRLSISPFGSVFLLARLATDGPAAKVIAAHCPQSGWHMCDWVNRLPADSDDFLWDGKGPVWSHPGGPIALSAEADVIVRKTIQSQTIEAFTKAIANTWHQLQMIALGDTLRPQWLEGSVGKTLSAYFPPRELSAYRASLQAAERLEPFATHLNAWHAIALVAGAFICLILLARAARQRDRVVGTLIVMVFLAIVVNAFATGALSRPHFRYQTRIAWMLVLVPLVVIPRQARLADPSGRSHNQSPRGA